MDPSRPRTKCAPSWPPPDLPASMEMDRGHWGFLPYMQASKSTAVTLPPFVLNSFNFGSSRSYGPELKCSESLYSELQQMSSSKSLVANSGGTQGLHFLTNFQSNGSFVNGQEIPFNLDPTVQVANLTRNSDKGCTFYETANNYTPCDNVGWGLSNMRQGGSLFSSMHHLSDGLALSEVMEDPKFKMMQRIGRVFCLRTRGDLLLNNMGCLIVVCVCHNMHLSVAKFCEHSGMPAANPGEAVCMETGENIALWRKIYFSKIGIRLPDDNGGWDLYDSSSPSHLVHRSSSASPCMLNKSSSVQATDLLDSLPKSVKFWGAVNLANNPPVEGISSTQRSDTFQINNSLRGPKNFQTIPGNSNGIQSSLRISKHALNDDQQYRGHEKLANCMNLFTKESSLFNFDLTSSNVKFSGSDSSVTGVSSGKAYSFGSNVIASNVELTLGQPSHSLASAKQSYFQPFNQSCYPQKSALTINQTSSFSVFDSAVHLDSSKTSSNILYGPSGVSVSHKGEKEIPLSYMRGDLTNGNIMETATIELMSDVDTSKRSIAPVYLQQVPSLGGSAIGHGVTHYGLRNNFHDSACAIPSTGVHNGRVAHAHLLTEGADRSLKSLSKLHLSNDLEINHGISSNGQSVSYVSPMPQFLFHNKQIGGAIHTPTNTCDHVKQTVSRPQGINANLSCDLTELLGCSRNSTEPSLLSPSITTMCSFSKLQSTSNKNEFTVGRQLLDESVGALSSKNAIESSKQDKPVHLLSTHSYQTNLCDKPHTETCLGSTDFIERQLQSSCQINTTVYPDPARQQLTVCCNHCLSNNSQNFANIGVCCHCPASVLQFSSGSRQISGVASKQSLLSSFQIRDSNVPGNIEHRRHDEVQLNHHVSCVCCHDGHPNCLPRIHNCIPNQRVKLEGHGNTVDGKAFTMDNELHSDRRENLLNLHIYSKNNSPFQWKDVPRKDVTHEKRAEALGTKQTHESHTSKIRIELKEPGANIELLKEKPLSDCPGSSAPAITGISVGKDSSALHDGCGESMIGNLVDEMSETGRCSSSDENECTHALKTVHSFAMSKPSTHESDLVNPTCGPGDHIPLLKGNTKERKKIRSTKWKKIDSSAHLVDYDSCNNTGCFDVSPKRDSRRLKEGYESSHEALNLKQVLSAPLSSITIFKKRKFSEDNISNSGKKPDFHEELISSPVTKKKIQQNHLNWSLSLDRRCIPCDENQNEVDACREKLRPVVCGRFGIISNEKHFQGHAKRLKIVSLSSILKVAKRCEIVEHDSKGELCSSVYMNPLSSGKNHVTSAKPPLSEKEKITEICSISKCPPKGQMPSTRTGRNDICCKNLELSYELQRNEGRCYVGQKVKESSRCCKTSVKKLNSQFKKMRKRTLSQLTVEVEQLKHSEVRPLEKAFESLLSNNPKSNACRLLRSIDRHSEHLADSINATEFSLVEVAHGPVLKSYTSCCVCGNLGEVEINRLLKCSSCFIRVHQACYGVHKVPKGNWCCRPCRANSKDMACVLCGYEGGAMTRAVRSNNTVKSLLNAWTVSAVSNTWKKDLGVFTATSVGEVSSVGDTCKRGAKISFICSKNATLETNKKTKRRALTCHFNVENTITAGVLDSTVKQWVHMVCGLWTPGTCCPNVHTMSAFDVSGASSCAKDVVCCICNRPGGSCIKCRVLNCSVMFHAWCAHQKGLLQSEIEGIDDENVGFYGRCLCHATNSSSHSYSHSVKRDVSHEDRPTCARTEGYKGRKAGDLRRYDIIAASSKNVGLVPEEQINAWVHINGQKSCNRRKMIKPLISDTEFDCRKEYARYKQAKGWKKLVVYKSGIHALGLYTSQFISRGGIVVEYVGEVVGLRVADKREREYQSGRKLLYESACYFFRVDKEHIVDATRKGGIARFVNHSCLPNCVARIISVRNEKKVIFFADRDINPGEEITYDYHFNHEDEGKKIPCYCRSKNCRRSLN